MKRITVWLCSCIFVSIYMVSNAIAIENTEIISCEQTYALCSAAKCIPDPRHIGYAICRCEVFDGISAGNESCQKRKPYIAKDDTKRIISTFSFMNARKPTMSCPSGTLWTNCVDAPCTVDPMDPTKSICSCPINDSGKITTFGGDCDATTCKAGFWSGALLEQNNALRTKLANEMDIDLSELVKQCKRQN